LPVHVRLGLLQYPDFEFDVEAHVDTGFDGSLTVPQGLIPDRVQPWNQQECILADGSSFYANIYRGFVTVGPLQPIPAIIIALPTQALLGLAVTNHFRLSFLYGREVILEQ
jgi:predicted aspartyl protease